MLSAEVPSHAIPGQLLAAVWAGHAFTLAGIKNGTVCFSIIACLIYVDFAVCSTIAFRVFTPPWSSLRQSHMRTTHVQLGDQLNPPVLLTCTQLLHILARELFDQLDARPIPTDLFEIETCTGQTFIFMPVIPKAL